MTQLSSGAGEMVSHKLRCEVATEVLIKTPTFIQQKLANQRNLRPATPSTLVP